ncbi:helix-turn-helix transcriptional regulator [Hyphomonas sp.]|uniref:helix-turn-helix domain-containing protein n=1 Tax=Hyphomonas sp. TaxID=87 RepID=UPI0025BA6248|nr:helix-turn-helix transcriptional regulator [Hyphomonas sp.]
MTHKLDFKLATSEAIEDVLSRRLEDIRLQRNITQKRLAEEAGVSRSTITRLAQDGKGISLDSFIRVLKALDIASTLDLVVPERRISPLEKLKLENRPVRQRARSRKKDEKKWTWDDAGDDA